MVTIVLPIPTTESDGLVPSLAESPSADHNGLPDRGKLSAASSEPRSGAGLPLGPSPETTRAGPGASGITVTDSDSGSMIVMTGPVTEPTQARAVRLGDGGRVRARPASGNGGSLNGQDLQLDSD